MLRAILRVQYFARVLLYNAAATIWRRLLVGPTFIAIAGSVGKTTTREVLAAIVAGSYPIAHRAGSSARNRTLARYMLTVRPRHRFAVVETGISHPGDMTRIARIVRPDVVVMLRVAHCHTNMLKTLDGIAEEKVALLRSLGPRGVAVLNGDDPRVAAMQDAGPFRSLRFGTDPSFDVWADEISACWPDRLSFRLHAEGETHWVRSRLVGAYWVTALLAAVTAARACGVLLAEAVARAESVEPFWGRLQPITLPSGATVLRDDYNGSIDTFVPALKVLEDARAERKILVASDYSDSKRSPRRRVRHLGQEAARVADMAVFVGERAERGVAGAVEQGMAPANAHAFYNIADATEFLRRELGEGDLVLIKGQSNHHLSRIHLGLIGEVTCRRPSCGKMILCDGCDLLGFQWTPALQGLMADPDARLDD